jgi:hypothetical protein
MEDDCRRLSDPLPAAWWIHRTELSPVCMQRQSLDQILNLIRLITLVHVLVLSSSG